MKIRLALNDNFVSRKIRVAAYGMLFLLTFFVPPFAKTQDRLNDANQVQAAENPGIAFKQNHDYIDADFDNMPLVDFFRTMGEIGGINIMLDRSITGAVTLKVVKVPWDELFDAVLKNHGLEKRIKGTLVHIVSKATLQEEAKQEEALKKANMMASELETRIKRLNYTKASELKTLLADHKTERGTVVVDERTNSLVLTDLPDSINKQISLIEALDVPQPQVEIETRIVSASRNFARDIGVQFGFVQGSGRRVTVGGSNAANLKTDPASRPMADTSSSSGPGVSTGAGSSDGNLNVNLPAGNAFGGIGISVGNIIDTFLLDAAITAGEIKGTAKLISQPKVAVQNNSPAVISSGTRFPVQVVSDNTASTQFFDAALMLTVTPQITYDGNIVLDLTVANNLADFGNKVNDVPSMSTSEVSTRIMVNDGGTTVLGGIIVEQDDKSENRVPGLASIPILGHLFRNSAVLRKNQEVMFFVTPRIIK